MNKPDILSDEELRRMALDCFGSRDGIRFIFPSRGEKIQEAMEDVAQAQRDADVDYYEPLFPLEYNKGFADGLKADLKRTEARIQQAKAEVIEEIERNCRGYEDNTVRHLLTSTFWQYLKSKYIKEEK